MTRTQKAEQYFMEGYNCSQAVFAAFADRYCFSEEQALCMTSTLGAGVSSLREICGVVTGMSLVCGLEKGNCEAGREYKKASYEANRALLDEFKQIHGSLICRELLGMSKDTVDKAAVPSERTEEYYQARPCLRFVRTAAKILEKHFPEK